jgi:hypothetical protein
MMICRIDHHKVIALIIIVGKIGPYACLGLRTFRVV